MPRYVVRMASREEGSSLFLKPTKEVGTVYAADERAAVRAVLAEKTGNDRWLDPEYPTEPEYLAYARKVGLDDVAYHYRKFRKWEKKDTVLPAGRWAIVDANGAGGPAAWRAAEKALPGLYLGLAYVKEVA